MLGWILQSYVCAPGFVMAAFLYYRQELLPTLKKMQSLSLRRKGHHSWSSATALELHRGCLSVLQARAALQTQKDTPSQSPKNLSTKAQDQPSATATAQPPPAKVQSHDTPSAVQSHDVSAKVQSHDVPSAVQSHDAPSEVQSHDLPSEVQSHDTPSVPAVVPEQAEAADEDEQEVAAVEASRHGRFDIHSSEDPVVLFTQAGVLTNSLGRHLLQHDENQAYFLQNYAKQIMKATQILSNTNPENQLLTLTQDMCTLGVAVIGHLDKDLSSRDKNELLARHAEVADSLLGRHKAVIAAPESADEAFFLASNRQSIAWLGRQLALVRNAPLLQHSCNHDPHRLLVRTESFSFFKCCLCMGANSEQKHCKRHLCMVKQKAICS